ncbi:MAG: hypothetical protein NTY01_23220 [Verrucomicrobia bacterium]|nr:hypothetical protein [Verrucomicrobiota bacterium]
MKSTIVAILLFVTFAAALDAAHVHSYTRKDGTFVSGYNTGSDRAFGKDFNATIGTILTGVILVVGVIWWIASAASSQSSSKFDARFARQREQEGIIQEQVRRAQMQLTAEANNPIARGLAIGMLSSDDNQTTRKGHPFKKLPLQPGSFFNRHPQQNAFIQLNNALAASDKVRQVTLDTIAKLNTTYRTDLHKTCPEQMLVMYKEFMAFCLADRQFTQEEVDDLWHLKAMFGISDKVHNDIYAEVGKEVYRRGIREVLADNQVTDEEKQWLDKLASDLELSEELKMGAYKTEMQAFLQNQVDRAIADRQLSPDEEREIHELAKRLEGEIVMDGLTTAALEKCRLMWRIAHGDPPILNAGLNLQKDEVCYFSASVTLHEMRRITKRVQWGGPQLRVKICKGLYWKMGDYAVNPVTQDMLTPIDSGTVYVTSKRILFNDEMKNIAIKLQKILDFTPYTDGVMVEKDTGRSPFFGFSSNIDLFAACLARAIQDAG